MQNIEAVKALLNQIANIASAKSQSIGTPSEVKLVQEALALLKVPTDAEPFALEMMACYYISDRGFWQGTETVYGTGMQIIETPNDTTHEVFDVKEKPLTDNEQKMLADAVRIGAINAAQLDLALTDLVNKERLPPGDYFVRVGW